MTSYVDYILTDLAPPWLLTPEGQQWLRVKGRAADTLAARARESVKTRFVAECPDDALVKHGRDRQLVRATGESLASYRARLVGAWDAWMQAGTPAGIISQLNALGYSSVAVFENNKTVHPPVGDLIVAPNDVTQSAWTKENCTAVDAQTIRDTSDSTPTAHRVYQDVLRTGWPTYATIEVKAGTAGYAYIDVGDVIALINLTTGVVDYSDFLSTAVQSVGDGWWRVTVYALSYTERFEVGPSTGSYVAYTGDGTGTIHVRNAGATALPVPFPFDGETSRWWRFWVYIADSPWRAWAWGTGHWGDGRTWGSTATVAEVETIKTIIRTWKAAHTQCAGVIVDIGPPNLVVDPSDVGSTHWSATGLAGRTTQTITENTSYGSHRVSQTVAGLVLANPFVVSVELKAEGRGYAFVSNNGEDYYACADLETTNTVTTEGCSGTNETLSDGWRRVTLSVSSADDTMLVIGATLGVHGEAYPGNGSPSISIRNVDVVQGGNRLIAWPVDFRPAIWV
jgi:hypothetical protein